MLPTSLPVPAPSGTRVERPIFKPAGMLLKYLGISIAWLVTGSVALLVLALPFWSLVIPLLVFAAFTALFCHRLNHQFRQYAEASRQQAFMELFDSHPLPQWLYAPDSGRLLRANQAALHLTGRDPGTGGLGVDELVEPLSGSHPLATAQALRCAGGESIPVRLQHGTCVQDGAPCGLLVAMPLPWPASPDQQSGCWEMEADPRPDSHGEQVWQEFLSHLWPEDRETVRQAHQRARRTGQCVLQYRYVQASGQVRHLFERLQVQVDPLSGQRMLRGAYVDLGEQPEMPGAGPSQQRIYERMVNGLPDGVVILRDDRVHFANKAARRMFRVGLGPNHPQFAQFIHPEVRSREVDRERALQKGQIKPAYMRQVRLVRADGSEFDAEVVEVRLETPGHVDVQLLIRDVSQTRLMQRELEDANRRLQALSQRLLEVQEAERRQLASDLHDDVGQQLTGLKLHLQLLLRQLDGDGPLARQTTVLSETVDTLLATIRRLSLALHPLQLENLGLEAAIRTHLGRFLNGSSLEWTFEVNGDMSNLPAQKALVAFRLCQEAVSNVVRHAKARRVQVSLNRREDGLHLHIVDDGIGFDVTEARQRSRSLGLTSMQERVAAMAGELKISSLKGAGTRISVRLPKTFAS